MGCDINFTVKGNVFRYKNTPIVSESSLSDVAQYLINNPKISIAIRDQLKLEGTNPVIRLNTGLISNYTANVLASRYPWMDWNDDILGAKILGLNNYIMVDNYGKVIEGPRVLSDGTIVVNINKREDVLIVCNYLNRKYKLENVSEETIDILKRYLFLENIFKEKLEELRKLLKELQSLTEDSPRKKYLETLPYSLIDVNPDINSILLDFILNSGSYKQIFAGESSFYKILLTAGLELDGTSLHSYGDSLTDEINVRIKDKSKKPYILMSELLQILESSGKPIPKFDKLNKSEKLKELLNIFRDLSVDFSYVPINIEKNRVYLQYELKTFLNQYDDFEIKTFKNLTPIEIDGSFDYRGYHIYKWKNKYIYSKGIINEFSYASRLYDTIQEILKQIDYKFNESVDSYYHFSQSNENILYSPYKYTPGTIIEVIDSSSLNLSKIKYGEVEDLFFNIKTKLKTIQEYLYNKYGISRTAFNTSEKALLFLHYMILNPTAKPQSIVNTVNNLPKKYYYIESSKFIKNKNFKNKYYRTLDKDSETRKKGAKIETTMYQTRIFELDINLDLDLYSPKYDGNLLVVTLRILKNLAELMSSKFGTPIEVLTFDEINDKFPELKLTSATKAFIRNGIIYINSSAATSEDVFHEYAHIFLGVLKSVNYELYEELMELMSTQDKKLQIKEAYSNLADLDINEEVFAFYFGRHLASSKVPSHLKDELDKAKKSISEGMVSIFNKGITSTSLFEGNIWLTMKDFTSNVLLLVEENNGLLINSDIGKYRKASNWISKLLSEGNIIEEC